MLVVTFTERIKNNENYDFWNRQILSKAKESDCI